MTSMHLMRWQCLATGHDPAVYDSAAEFTRHMQEAHAGAFPADELPFLAEISQHPLSPTVSSCPFCPELPATTSPETPEGLEEHVAQHLQELDRTPGISAFTEKVSPSPFADAVLNIETQCRDLASCLILIMTIVGGDIRVSFIPRGWDSAETHSTCSHGLSLKIKTESDRLQHAIDHAASTGYPIRPEAGDDLSTIQKSLAKLGESSVHAGEGESDIPHGEPRVTPQGSSTPRPLNTTLDSHQEIQDASSLRAASSWEECRYQGEG